MINDETLAEWKRLCSFNSGTAQEFENVRHQKSLLFPRAVTEIELLRKRVAELEKGQSNAAIT